MKRSLPALHLSKTPLIFVLAQVRFAPITQIGKFLPDIQEALRHQGFPGLATRKFDVVITGAEGQAQRQERLQWEFLHPDRTQSIIVDEGSVVLQTSAYSTGEKFLEQLAMALKITEACAKPVGLLRVGLRYVDLINPIDGAGLDKLIRPALGPAAVSFQGEPVTHLWESLRQTSATTKLLVRYTEASRGFAFPPDLGPFISLMLSKPVVQEGPFGLLDTDHFDEGGSDFSVETALNRASNLHDVLDQSFRQLVTDDALRLWK